MTTKTEKKIEKWAMEGKSWDNQLRWFKGYARKTLGDWEFTLRLHPVAQAEPDVEKLIGYFPSGKFQVLAKKGKKEFSIVKGMVSRGLYEIAHISNQRKFHKTIVRFKNAKDVINFLKNYGRTDH